MREIRPSGSEGGAGQKPRSYLYPHADPCSMRPNGVGVPRPRCQPPPCTNPHHRILPDERNPLSVEK